MSSVGRPLPWVSFFAERNYATRFHPTGAPFDLTLFLNFGPRQINAKISVAFQGQEMGSRVVFCPRTVSVRGPVGHCTLLSLSVLAPSSPPAPPPQCNTSSFSPPACEKNPVPCSLTLLTPRPHPVCWVTPLTAAPVLPLVFPQDSVRTAPWPCH